MTLDHLGTPALLLDVARLDRNLAAMQARADRLGVRLRPHAKTHKSAAVARRQVAAGARGLTVATLAEARYFADAGFDDLTWAFPFPLSLLDDARRLAERITLRVTLDHIETARRLGDTGMPWRVWLKVDCGYHRAGIDPASEDALTLARFVGDHATMRLEGLITHSGHAYHARTVAERRTIAEAERRAAAGFRERLAADGFPVEASVGSTPMMTAVEDLHGVQEARPGNYAFFDAMQVVIGSCADDDIAVSVLATVISAPAGLDHVVIDAGALALSKDTGCTDPPHFGHVMREDGTPIRGAVVRSVSQEHGLVTADLPVGMRVRVVPNHSCLTAACFDEYVVLDGHSITDRWEIGRTR